MRSATNNGLNTVTVKKRKLAKLRSAKMALLQQLFPQPGAASPGLRFTNFDDKSQQRKLGDLITRNGVRNKDLKVTNVESISNQVGFIKQTDQFNNYSVASQDLSNYYVIKPGYFAYNPSRIDIGSIDYKRDDQLSLVSPLYVSFYTDERINNDYFLDWVKTDHFQSQRQRLSEGSVRKMLSFSQLAEMKFPFKSYKEQEKVSTLLKLVEKRINLAEHQLTLLRKVSRLLLHKMIL
ncbi:restriction endonuclease subunit S [Fructilactobacillus carniphilus]|uniref:Type I restriction modification DNA specificity domain-containing protein n=1 Tax=Fructilactobacillus carniphilus TaxID=2940297 RepID=A0ABY5BVX9_9LACO|nr:hypothetical protein [Fructilactobacillus carniphilus]USS90649.1 hypothetical protein M3M37_07415 [Fructilactobacillus carniphilus]